MTVKELSERMTKFMNNLENHIESVVTDNDILVSLNKTQLKQSRLNTGQTIKPPYSQGYSLYKGFDNPDLRDTGDFYAGMYIKADPGSYLISSEDWKTEKLISRYSPEIFGIEPAKQNFAKKVTSVMLSDIFKKEVLN